MENKPQSHAECALLIEISKLIENGIHELRNRLDPINFTIESQKLAGQIKPLIARHVEAHTAPVSRTAEEVAENLSALYTHRETNGPALQTYEVAALIQQALDAARADQHAKTWAMAMKVAGALAEKGDWCGRDELACDLSQLGCPPLEQEGV